MKLRGAKLKAPEIDEASLPLTEAQVSFTGAGKTPREAAKVALKKCSLNGARPTGPVQVKFSLGSPRGIPSTWLAHVTGRIEVGKGAVKEEA